MGKTKNWMGMALAVLVGTGVQAWGDELLSGPYRFDSAASVHVKPAMLADGWGMTLGGAWDTVINRTVTAGAEVNVDVPVVPYPVQPSQTIQLLSAGLRLGAMFASNEVWHPQFNNTVGVGLVAGQTYLFDELTGGGEVNVTKGIRVFAGAGYRYTYGINFDRGVSDLNTRGLVLDVGLRYGEF
jgi:hypothetical protein